MLQIEEASLIDKSAERQNVQTRQVDHFLQDLYHLWENCGFISWFVKQLSSFLILVFIETMAVSVVGFVTLDSTGPSVQFGPPKDWWWILLTVLLLIVLLLYTFWRFIALLWRTSCIWAVSRFWKRTTTQLGLHRDISIVSWSHVVLTLCQAYNEKENQAIVPWRLNCDQLTPEIVMTRLLRQENWIVAMIHHKMIDFSHCPMTFWTEWNIRTVFLNSVLGTNGDIVGNVNRIRRACLIYAVSEMVLMPVILILGTVFLILQTADDYHARQTSFTEPVWSSAAKWNLRLYNECPHLLESRLRQSKKAAGAIRQSRQMQWTIIFHSLTKCLHYILGSICGLIVLYAAFVDDDVLIQVQVFDRTLLFWLGVFGSTLALVRQRQTECLKQDGHSTQTFEASCHRLNVHLSPKQFHKEEAYIWVNQSFQPRWRMFQQIALSMVKSPLFLLSIRKDSMRLTKWMLAHAKQETSVGTCVVLSLWSCYNNDMADDKVEVSRQSFKRYISQSNHETNDIDDLGMDSSIG